MHYAHMHKHAPWAGGVGLPGASTSPGGGVLITLTHALAGIDGVGGGAKEKGATSGHAGLDGLGFRGRPWGGLAISYACGAAWCGCVW
eukprot:1138887-Pelagomonas_calceolata.AAC.1